MESYFCSSVTIKSSAEHILRYVREHGLVVYGGLAVHLLLEDLTGVGVYDPARSVADVDVYSPDFVEDAKRIVRFLEGVGYTGVYASRALFPFTVRIWIDGVCVCDVTHLQPSSARKIDPHATRSGILVCGALYLQGELLLDLVTPFVYSSVLKRRRKIKERFDRLAGVGPPRPPPSPSDGSLACPLLDGQAGWCFTGACAYAILCDVFHHEVPGGGPPEGRPGYRLSADGSVVRFFGVSGPVEWLTDGILFPYSEVGRRRPSFTSFAPQVYEVVVRGPDGEELPVVCHAYLSKQVLASHAEAPGGGRVRVANVYTLMLHCLQSFYASGDEEHLRRHGRLLQMAREVEDQLRAAADERRERRLVRSPLYLNLETIGRDYKNLYNLLGDAFNWPTKYTSADDPEKTFDPSTNPMFERAAAAVDLQG